MANSDPCICKHSRYEHIRPFVDGECGGYLVAGEWCDCGGFQLDNLALVEQVANQRKLI
jgi:hypothetical protein